ncbi:hypothetical protein ABT147_33280 [Streptomyces sp. NPDC001868]|uniref:hypothetical protein n=1 Tax=Streptomyces sp. NPDC001868 TaxID=3154401 RepID=UPI00331B8876
MTDLAPLRAAVAEAEQRRAGLGPDATPARRRAAYEEARAAHHALHEALRTFTAVTDVDELFARLDPEVPLMLAPVRLETRLRPSGGPATSVDVRIFPDDIHIDSHDPLPTEGEVQQGKRYWRTVFRAGRTENGAGDRDRIRLGAWEQLCGALGAARARQIATLLAPTADDRPEAPLAESETGPEPAWPTDLPTRSRGWDRPSTASTLPDQFIVQAFQQTPDGEILVGERRGEAVPDTLQVGPDPDAPAAPPAADGSGPLTDPGLHWLTHFATARDNGLAVTVPLDKPGYDPTRRPLLSRVIAFGVSASLDPQASAERVARLLTGRARDGQAAFVAQDTPTNNVPQARRTPERPPDVDALLPAPAAAAPAPDPWANATRLATALGIPEAAAAELSGGTDPEQADARALQLALWSATGDFFLDQLMESGSRTQETGIDLDWLRLHQADLVRARGPLPALRLGKQPYGVLPLTVMRRWQPDPQPGRERGQLAGMHRVLTTLRPFWQVGVDTLPRVGGPAEPPEQALPLPKGESDVLRALGLAAVSRSVDVRAVRGALNACYTNRLLGLVPECGAGPEARLSAALNRALGLDYEPVVSRHQNARHPSRLWLPAARLTDLAEGTDPVGELAAFLEGVVDRFELIHLLVRPSRARTLLEALLRHSANLEYGHAAAAAAYASELVKNNRLRFAEVMLAPAAALVLVSQAGLKLKPFAMKATLGLALPGVAEADARTVHDAVDIERSALASAVAKAVRDDRGILRPLDLERPWSVRLAEVDAALRYLATRVHDWAKAGKDPFALMERLLGECLDLASYRLDAWITSLATVRLLAMRAGTRRPTGLQLGAYGWVRDLSPREGRRSEGFVLAPSLAQATTAAVLHSGYLSHPSDPGAFAVNLTSGRTRVAMAVLDGVRQGQPVGALLGYRLERRLHEARENASEPLELDRVIAPLRAQWPLRPVHHPAPDAQGFVAAHDVVDGAALGEIPVETAMGLLKPGITPALDPIREEPVVRAALEALHEDVDAVGDLLLAESVHQLANGNPDRAGATLADLAAGGQAPPRPEFLDTPAQGTPVTHRLLVVVPENTPPAQGWDGPDRRARPRAAAEPRLDAWAGHQLGRTDRVRLRTAWRRPGHAAPAATRTHPWPLTGHCALDVIALAASGELRATLSEALTAHRPGDLPGDAVAELLDGRGGDWPRSTVSLQEFEALAGAVATVLATGRPGAPTDLAPAATPPEQVLDETELRGRAQRTIDALEEAAQAADLPRLAAHGIVVPASAAADDQAARTEAAVQEAHSRLGLAQKALAGTGPQAAAAALREVFGPGFRAVGLGTPPDPAALTASFGPGLDRGGTDDIIPRDWLERAATARPGAAALADLLVLGEATGTGGDFALRVGQTPFTPGDRWVGARRTAEPPPATGLAVHGRPAADPAKPAAVLVIDEWPELIPAQRHTAGVSFHYDAPGARPPQAVLLAVPPVVGSPWTAGLLGETVREALDLTELRLVDLQALGWVGRYLPGVYLPQESLGTAPGVSLLEIMKSHIAKGAITKITDQEA